MKIKGALILAALAVAMMVVIALADRQAPSIPRDTFHTIVINNAACTTCHTPGKQAPLKASHPSKEECMTCHKARPPR
jgi:hypothetical protein